MARLLPPDGLDPASPQSGSRLQLTLAGKAVIGAKPHLKSFPGRPKVEPGIQKQIEVAPKFDRFVWFKHPMIISFDLDGLLIPMGKQFATARRGFVATIMRTERLRAGTRELTQNLRDSGHTIWICTSSERSVDRVKRLFKWHGIEIDRVINGIESQAKIRSAGIRASKAPHLFGIDLHIDDAPGVRIECKGFGTDCLIISPGDRLWATTVLIYAARDKTKVPLLASSDTPPGYETIMKIVSSRATSSKPEWFADILLRLVWMTDHEQINVPSAMERWLRENSDPFLIEIALQNDEVYLFKTQEEGRALIEPVKAKWPELAQLCDQFIAYFDRP